MDKKVLLEKFHKRFFTHWTTNLFNDIHNKYYRAFIATLIAVPSTVCIGISDLVKFCYKAFMIMLSLPVCFIANIIELLEFMVIFIKIAYYWDELKE